MKTSPILLFCIFSLIGLLEVLGQLGSESDQGYVFIDGNTNGYPESRLRLVKWSNSNAHIDVMDNRDLMLNFYRGGDVLFGTANSSAHSVFKKTGQLAINRLDVASGFNLDVNGNSIFRGSIRSSNGSDYVILNAINNSARSELVWGDDQGDRFRFFFNHWNGSIHDKEVMTLLDDGNVGIGTSTPDSKLTVKGEIHAEEIKVDLNVPGPDYVFEPDYPLTPLDEIEKYITENKHLPEIPAAKEMEEDGILIGELNMLLLKKIEELTLYVIKLKQQTDRQQREIENLKK